VRISIAAIVIGLTAFTYYTRLIHIHTSTMVLLGGPLGLSYAHTSITQGAQLT
jgi:hypothetical protein